MTRAEVSEAQAQLRRARERLARLRDERASFGPGPQPRRFLGLHAMLLVLATSGVLGSSWATRRPAPALSSERLARRDALRADYEAAVQKVEASADTKPEQPESIPSDAYPALSELRPLLAESEGVLAWTQIGLAACAVKQSDLARRAYRKLDFEGYASKRQGDAGAMAPGISAAIRRLDEGCREHDIHVLVPETP